MKTLILTFSLLVVITSCVENNSNTNSYSRGVAKQDISGFKELCDKIPVVSLSSSMSSIDFKPLTGEEVTESGKYRFDEELGQPLGKIVNTKFVAIFFSAPISGDMTIIQTYTPQGEKISRQNLLSTEGVGDLDDSDIRCESTGLKMDKDLNVYCYYKNAYVKNGGKDTVVKSFVEKHYKIDNLGKILEIEK